MTKQPKTTRVRDNDTGEFTTKAKAKSDPKGTTVETVKSKPAKLTDSQLLAAKTALFAERTSFDEADILKAIQHGYVRCLKM